MKISKKKLSLLDLGSKASNFQVLNPDQLICTSDKNTTFEMEFTIDKGRGYVPARGKSY